MNKKLIWIAVATATAFVAARGSAAVRSRRAAARRAMESGGEQDRVNEALEETFPASDPPSHTATIGTLAR